MPELQADKAISESGSITNLSLTAAVNPPASAL